MNATPTNNLDPGMPQSCPSKQHFGRFDGRNYEAGSSSGCGFASMDEENEELPVRVPNYLTCPHIEMLQNEIQAAEWIQARAMEFAFTKHGERKSKKSAREAQDRKPSTLGAWRLPNRPAPCIARGVTHSQATMIVLLDSAHGRPSERTKEPSDDTRQTAEPSRRRSSSVIEVMNSLSASSEAVTSHARRPAGEQQGPVSPLDIYRKGSVGESQIQVHPDIADDSSASPPRGRRQYDSIVEYRCCWSGTYRPRVYNNKTGRKRQRLPSTKVSVHCVFWPWR